jgi:hypothetical protein
MKQGRASRDVDEGWKREPRPRAINIDAVSQIGQSMGNHVTDRRHSVADYTKNIYAGRGYTAPMRSQSTKKGGSQGKY